MKPFSRNHFKIWGTRHSDTLTLSQESMITLVMYNLAYERCYLHRLLAARTFFRKYCCGGTIIGIERNREERGVLLCCCLFPNLCSLPLTYLGHLAPPKAQISLII